MGSGGGDPQLDLEVKGGSETRGTHRKSGEEGIQQLTRWYANMRKCFLVTRKLRLEDMK